MNRENLASNAMLLRKPELFEEWDFEKNDDLGLNIYKLTYGSNKKAWWKCLKCKNSYLMRIESRTLRGYNCPKCKGVRTSYSNSLASKDITLSSQWHPTKNGDLTTGEISCWSMRKVWWLGECGHEWEARVNDRSRGGGCPYCNQSPKLLRGFNDVWSTNPKLASMLVNPEDGYKYTQGSQVRVDWKCPSCKAIKNHPIFSVKIHGLYCNNCKKNSNRT